MSWSNFSFLPNNQGSSIMAPMFWFIQPALAKVVGSQKQATLFQFQASISIRRRQWSLEPQQSTPLRARTLIPLWKPREAKT